MALSRRHFLKTTVGLAAGGMIGGGVERVLSETSEGGKRPNIVFILADDLGYGDLGCYGQKKIKTPNLDRMATEGIRFVQAYAGSTVCAPSRSVLMTGQHTGHTRVRGNMCVRGGTVGYKGKRQVRRMNLTDQDRTVADVLREAGYRTCLIGKWHLEGSVPDAIPLNRGFDEFFGWQMWAEQTFRPSYYFPAFRLHNRQIVAVPENADGKRGLYETDLVFRQACEFIDRSAAGKQPFFLYLAPIAPHDPLESPDAGPYADEPWPANMKTYAAMVSYLDLGVGRVLESLKAAGIDQQTVVFFCSDNGARSSGSKPLTEVAQFFRSSGPLTGYKRDMYEGGIRVPMIVRWPGKIPAGTTSEAICYFADFLPTAADLAGITPPKEIDGVSVVPSLLGRKQDELTQRFLYWEFFFFGRGFQQAVRWGPWKAVRLAPDKPLELYNLVGDVGETKNVAREHPEIVRRIEEYLKTARTESENWPTTGADG